MISRRDLLMSTAAIPLAQLWADEFQRRLGQQSTLSPSFDLVAWGKEYFPHYLGYEASDMHRYLAKQLMLAAFQRHFREVVIGPRGSAKSTWSTLIYVLAVAVHGLDPYIWIISDTSDQASTHLANVRAEVEDNQRLAEDYPQAIKGARCNADRIILGNGVRIEGLGTGQKVRGRRRGAARPSLVVLDDPENDEQARSPTQREYHQRWFSNALLKAGDERTNVIVLGSALHRDCLTMSLARNPGWESKVFRKIQEWPKNMHLWADWENIFCNIEDKERVTKAKAFYEANKAAMDEGAVLGWPDRHSLYEVMVERATDGHNSFECEQQGNPINPENCEWPEDYFADHIWADFWPDFRSLVMRIMFLDPSKGADSKHGDYSSIVWLGVDPQSGLIYVDADLKRRTTDEIVTDYVARAKLFVPDAAGVETNVFQQLLCKDLEREANDTGVMLPIVEVENRVKKPVRIRRLGPYLSMKRFRFRKGSAGCALLVDQLKDFPTGDHDDGPDALEGAIRLGSLLQGGDEDGITRIEMGIV